MKILKITETVAKKLVNGTLPDIDTDFPGKSRGVIKEYIEKRFGEEQVCSVGTFTTMLIKGLTKDLARIASVDFSEANLITSIIEQDDKKLIDLFKRAASEPKLKDFIKDNSDLFYMMPTLLGQPKTTSIHACAMIVFPSVMKAAEWVPLRKQNGQIVSEWSGSEMDEAGFLKDDILGIKQLDKFTDILNLIEKNGKKRPDIYNLPHNKEVYRYFSNGWNGDVFQFNTSGLTNYSQVLKPQTMEDLVVATAIFRPGPMENGYHETYAKCKNEGREPEYLWGTEKITQNTFGLLVYQEQIMHVCQQIGGLTMREADDVRSAMGKTKLDVLNVWKPKVKNGFLEKGCEEETFENIWSVMMEFAKYCFNRSHAVVYAMTSYVSQWLKVNHPIEYWTVALDYTDEDKALELIAEILLAGKITISPPDINTSQIQMVSNADNNTIYWGISSIKGIGEITAKQIIEDRKKYGGYTSLTDFIHRHSFKGSKVKKQNYEALIACGAFDEIYGIQGREHMRLSLTKRFRLYKKVKVSNTKTDLMSQQFIHETWFWQLKQKALIKLVFIPYSELVEEYELKSQYANARDLATRSTKQVRRSFGGYVVDISERSSKKGKFAKLKIETNFKIFNVIVWAESYAILRAKLKESKGKLILFDASMAYEEKWSKGVQFTIDKGAKLVVLG